jgi:hypothetical protein
MSLSLEYFHWEPNFEQLFPGKPRGTNFNARFSTGGLFSSKYLSIKYDTLVSPGSGFWLFRLLKIARSKLGIAGEFT